MSNQKIITRRKDQRNLKYSVLILSFHLTFNEKIALKHLDLCNNKNAVSPSLKSSGFQFYNFMLLQSKTRLI